MIFVIAVLVFIVLAVIVRQHESNMQNKVNRQIIARP